MAKNKQTDSNFQDDEEEIITLTSDSGEDVDFVDVARIDCDNKRYALLQPVELFEGMNEDEVLIFEIAKSKKGKDMEDLEIVLDEKIIEKVMEKYNKLYDEMFENESKPEEEVKKNGRK